MSLFTPARRGLSALALVLALALPAVAARADINVGPDTTSSINTLSSYDKLTQAQQQALLTRYAALSAQIKANQTKAAAMRVALDSGTNADPTITEAIYTALIAKITSDQADAVTLRDWISGASDVPPVTNYPGNTNTNNNSNNNSSSNSGGGESPLSGMAQQLGQQLAQQMMGGMQGGLQNGIGSLTGGMGNPAGGSGAATGPATSGGGNNTGPNSGNLTEADKAAAKKAMEQPDPDKDSGPCTPAPSKVTHTPKQTPTAIPDGKTGSQTADNAGKAKDDIVSPSPAEEAANDRSNPNAAEHGTGKADKPNPECKTAEVNTPNPTGDAAAIKAKLDAIIASGKFQCNASVTRCSYVDASGKWVRANGQACVAFSQAWDPSVGAASNWYADKQAIKGGMQPGDILATANDPGGTNGKYCTVVGHNCGVPGANRYHTVVFYSYLDDNDPSKGFIAVGQANGQAPYKSTFVPGPGGEDADKYYTIRKGPAFVSQFVPVMSPVWLALKLVPLYEALLKA